MTRREWAWAAGFAALVMAVTTIPYLVGGLSQTGAWRFGGFVLGVEDGNSYIAKMEQGARGAWLFTLPYSSEPQRGVPLYEFHLLLGKVAGPQHDAQVLAYHLARVILGMALLLISYRFLAEFLPDVRSRRLGLALVAVGGGLGWLLALLGLDHLFGSLPIDFYSPEAYTFLILYALPHLAAARCLFLLGLLAYLRGRGVAAGLLLLGVSLIQPLSVIVAWVVIGVDVVLLWITSRLVLQPPTSNLQPLTSKLPIALATVLISSPFALYTVYLFSADPLLRQWNAQNILASPHPLHYVLGYGVFAVLGVGGWRTLLQRRPELARLTAGWALAVPFLLYAPLTTQRRLVEGFQLPLVGLAVLGLAGVVQAYRRWALSLVLALTVPTSALLLAGGVVAGRTLAEPLFHPADQLASFDWLSQHARPGQVVLSSFETGNALPAYTPLVAYIGHGPETVFLARKQPLVAAFYRSSTGEEARRGLLADGRVAFVVFGPHERALGDFDPDVVDYLRWRFSSGGYAIYEVIP
jgi:hypothetical protein